MPQRILRRLHGGERPHLTQHMAGWPSELWRRNMRSLAAEFQALPQYENRLRRVLLHPSETTLELVGEVPPELNDSNIMFLCYAVTSSHIDFCIGIRRGCRAWCELFEYVSDLRGDIAEEFRSPGCELPDVRFGSSVFGGRREFKEIGECALYDLNIRNMDVPMMPWHFPGDAPEDSTVAGFHIGTDPDRGPVMLPFLGHATLVAGGSANRMLDDILSSVIALHDGKLRITVLDRGSSPGDARWKGAHRVVSDDAEAVAFAHATWGIGRSDVGGEAPWERDVVIVADWAWLCLLLRAEGTKGLRLSRPSVSTVVCVPDIRKYEEAVMPRGSFPAPAGRLGSEYLHWDFQEEGNWGSPEAWSLLLGRMETQAEVVQVLGRHATQMRPVRGRDIPEGLFRYALAPDSGKGERQRGLLVPRWLETDEWGIFVPGEDGTPPAGE